LFPAAKKYAHLNVYPHSQSSFTGNPSDSRLGDGHQNADIFLLLFKTKKMGFSSGKAETPCLDPDLSFVTQRTVHSSLPARVSLLGYAIEFSLFD